MPMAIKPSVRYDCDFHLIELPNRQEHHLLLWDFVVEAKTQTISESIALFLGISYEACIDYIGENNFTHCQFPNSGFKGHYCRYRGITLEQIQILWDKAQNNRADKYKPILSELILTQVLPLFNRHDKKEITVMTKQLSTENNSQKFHNDLFGDLSVLTHQDGSLWFVASEVASILEYSETSVMLRRIDSEDMQKIAPTILVGANSKAREITIINESGLYTAVLGSKKPEAKQFKKWITNEVIPAIRRNGGYGQIERKPEPVKTIRHTNASAMRAADRMIEKMTISDDRKTLARAYLLHKEYDIPVETMLPAVAHKLSATEIGKQLGISAQMVGRIVNKLDIKNNPELCEHRLDKSPHSIKEVETCYYAPSVVDMVKAKLNERKAS